jgi:hypothetical protein
MRRSLMFVVLIVAGLAAAPAGAQSMPLPTFLSKATALQKKGPMALFSGDLKVLKREIQASAGSIRAERLAAVKAGRRPPFCPPEKGGALDSDELLRHLRAVPTAQQARMTTRDGLRSLLVRKYPCPA